jgi:hypothetical protein
MRPTRAALERRLNALESRALPNDGPRLELVLHQNDGPPLILILNGRPDAPPDVCRVERVRELVALARSRRDGEAG